MTKQVSFWKYLGGGFLPDVPARDMTREEAEERQIVAVLKRSPLYEAVYEDRNEIESSPRGEKEQH